MRYLVLLLLLLLLPGAAEAQQYGGTVYCNNTAVYSASTSGYTKLVAATAAGAIFICGYTLASNAAVNVSLAYGTSVSTACDTGAKAITPVYAFAANTAGLSHIADTASNYRGMFVPQSNDLCINASAGSAVQAIIYYFQQK
jgi:hypothetical protein